MPRPAPTVPPGSTPRPDPAHETPEQQFARLKRSQRGRRNAIVGKCAEQVVLFHLNRLGLKMIAKVHNAWRVKRVKGRIVSAKPAGKVAGDFTAIEPGTGRAVLIEVKRRAEPLTFSDLERHQVVNLRGYVAAGARSILAWVTPTGQVYLLDWETYFLSPGDSLSAAIATERSLNQP
jgi:hypothetical protein